MKAKEGERMTHLSLFSGIGGLDADAGEAADLAGHGGDGILGGVQGDRDDIDALLPIRNAHSADDVFAVFMEDVIQLFHAVCVLHDDTHNSHSCCHIVSPLCSI